MNLFSALMPHMRNVEIGFFLRVLLAMGEAQMHLVCYWTWMCLRVSRQFGRFFDIGHPHEYFANSVPHNCSMVRRADGAGTWLCAVSLNYPSVGPYRQPLASSYDL